MYKNDPHFSNAKVIYTIYNQDKKLKFSKDFKTKLNFDEIPTEKLNLQEVTNVNKLHEIVCNWSDAVSIGSAEIDEKILNHTQNSVKSILEYHDEEQTIEAHQNFYDKVLSENGVLA